MPIVNPIWFYIMSISTGLKFILIAITVTLGVITFFVLINIREDLCEPKDLKKTFNTFGAVRSAEYLSTKREHYPEMSGSKSRNLRECGSSEG